MVNRLFEFIFGVLKTYFLCDNDIRTFVAALIQAIKNWFVNLCYINLKLSCYYIFLENEIKTSFFSLLCNIFYVNKF